MSKEINPEELEEYKVTEGLKITIWDSHIQFDYKEDGRYFSRPAGQAYVRNPISNKLEKVTEILDSNSINSCLVLEGKDGNGNIYTRKINEKEITSIFLPKVQQK